MKLKPFQQEAVESIRNHPHTLLIAPTGSGKSLVFQTYLLENARSVRAILVSPLNALARQHHQQLSRLGIRSTLGVGKSGMGPPDGPGVWIINPERLSGRAATLARSWRPDFLIVDEAHCIWEWGGSFRPAFSRIPDLPAELGISKGFWCTATLPAPARAELRKSLGISMREIGSFSVPGSLSVRRIRSRSFERIDLLRTLIGQARGRCGMIFVNARASSERIQAYLGFWGIPSVFYHAGMGSDERIALEMRLRNHRAADGPIWVVATSAFGMGMDYAFLETCILFEPSFSLLSLAQALGRVGRSGRPASAFVLWEPDDFHRGERILPHSPENRSRLEEVRAWCESPADPRISLEKFFNEGYEWADEHPQRSESLDQRSPLRQSGGSCPPHLADRVPE
jgi:ATP-dependent DNA helicase RecQ